MAQYILKGRKAGRQKWGEGGRKSVLALYKPLFCDAMKISKK